MIILDTHVLLWMDQNDAALGAASRDQITQAWQQGDVVVSAISFWECAMLAQRGRIVLPCSIERWRGDLIDAGVKEIPVDGRVGLAAVALDWQHRDPADRFIAATAMQFNATLLTADEKILDWVSALKRFDARK